MWLNLVYVALGGSLGAAARYAVYQLPVQSHVPTAIVNILGSLIFGFAAGYIGSKYPQNTVITLLLLTGFLGSFTTFSTFASDIANALKHQQYLQAAAHLLLQNTLAIASIFLGLKLASLLTQPTH